METQLSASQKPPIHYGTIVMRGLRLTPNLSPIMPRDASLSDRDVFLPAFAPRAPRQVAPRHAHKALSASRQIQRLHFQHLQIFAHNRDAYRPIQKFEMKKYKINGNYFPLLVKSNQNLILFIIFRLICSQT